MYLVIDNATNNVLGEFDSFHEAEQQRIRIVGMNPPLAEYVEVVDLERTVSEQRVDDRNVQPA